MTTATVNNWRDTLIVMLTTHIISAMEIVTTTLPTILLNVDTMEVIVLPK
eukprot:CAMPEP_0194106740 /NCGR_PEP_ID=MMETSP0150-20130528/6725_1 /TAXON_ID=122233 /ORGANISM="Chaetoceros debilis, Strain MM31A-1" /LENGTH=49 /DNA_ID= /DNA_START= /DNA_END= /DNA_ORIENTATION=